MAVHDLDLARFLVGEVEEVHSWGTVLTDSRFAEAEDADTAVTFLRFVNGAFGVVETSRRSNWGYDIRTEVAGAEGKVVVEGVQKTPAVFSRNFTATFDQLEAFFKALQDGQQPTPGAEDALETLRLAIAAARSWREKRSIKLSEIPA
jgi:myo-inositol 2-dehydrogenase/D-chiro-inositol 1-dehydrogenase